MYVLDGLTEMKQCQYVMNSVRLATCGADLIFEVVVDSVNVVNMWMVVYMLTDVYPLSPSSVNLNFCLGQSGITVKISVGLKLYFSLSSYLDRRVCRWNNLFLTRQQP